MNVPVIPDVWQARAVTALRQGLDVIVHAPTGAGKTFVFELLQASLKGQAVYTVPTRALANDKLAEWRARGWDVGIATGDMSHRLDARVVVATLETQKGKFLRRSGPRLLVIDEYQMLADERRGADYELALALSPAETQLLLLSGSVANPEAVATWLRRLGRNVEVVSTTDRPVPLEEADLDHLPATPFERQIRGYWPRYVARALFANLGPVLLFAPRRQASEELARELAGALPIDEPLALTTEQTQLAGEPLAKLLRRRVAYHHSGLSYAVRAGLIEPLAKAGQLRAVVATNGLAAGVNFSLRSVLITDTRFTAGYVERELRPDELLQMFGRAGRRGLDDCGYVLLAPHKPRLHDGRQRVVKRPSTIDWPALIAVMQEAALRGERPYPAALDLTARLFSTQRVPLGVEENLDDIPRPCGLVVEAERARFARPLRIEMQNSRGEWEPAPDPAPVLLGDALVRIGDGWRPALASPDFLSARVPGRGQLCKRQVASGYQRIYGRELALASKVSSTEVRIAPAFRAAILALKDGPRWKSSRMTRDRFDGEFAALAARVIGDDTIEICERGNLIFARIDLSAIVINARRDSHGAALIDPPTRKNHPAACQSCERLAHCENASAEMTSALAWRRLGLVEPDGRPTRRGVIFSAFNRGEGLAVAAALEDDGYPVGDLIFDVANLRAGHRFSAEGESISGNRLGAVCLRTYERAEFPGYLENGVPPHYGDGASDLVRELHSEPTEKRRLVTEMIRAGDIERVFTEWRSLVRQIAAAPDYPWTRWRDLQQVARTMARSATLLEPAAFPPLTSAQSQPRAHRLGAAAGKLIA